jgi:hypothetical protein
LYSEREREREIESKGRSFMVKDEREENGVKWVDESRVLK